MKHKFAKCWSERLVQLAGKGATQLMFIDPFDHVRKVLMSSPRTCLAASELRLGQVRQAEDRKAIQRYNGRGIARIRQPNFASFAGALAGDQEVNGNPVRRTKLGVPVAPAKIGACPTAEDGKTAAGL